MKTILRFIFKLTPLRISMATTFAVLVLMVTGARNVPGMEIFELFELKIYDFRLLLRGEQPTGDHMVLVAIDDKTLDDLGRWPFSRSRMGDAVKYLHEDGAKVIAWDVLFSEEDKNSELVKLRELRQELEQDGLDGVGQQKVTQDAYRKLQETQRAIEQLRRRLPASARSRLDKEFAAIAEPLSASEAALGRVDQQQQRFYGDVVVSESKANNDQYFADRIKEAENVILGYFFHDSTESIGYVRDLPVEEREARISSSKVSILRQPPGFEGPLPGWPRYEEIEPNIGLYSEATKHFGSFTIQQDIDGAIRNYPMFVNFNGEAYYPSLALKSIELFYDTPIVVKIADNGQEIESLKVGSVAIPVDQEGNLLINYRGPGGGFETVSFSDVVFNRFEPGTFTDKIALIGPTAIGIMDLRVTPFDRAMPGVEVHGNVIDNVLQNDFYQKPLWMKIFDVLAVLGLGLLLGIFLAPLSALTIGFVAAGITVIYLFGGQWLLVQQGIWLATVYPLMNLVFASAGIVLYKYYTEERAKKQIRGAFQFYLSPAVVEEVVDNPDKLRLGGEKREISVLFSDIRSFTTISENLDAEELSTLLNEYLTPMTDVIYEQRGTLDKYMGDAIMAFFGAPLEQPDHAMRACESALGMMDALWRLQPVWEKRGYPKIDHGMGINTGIASVGNMGSAQRFDYTIMGDTVNLGARAESINKQYGTYIIITEFTYEAIKQYNLFTHELDLVQVKGKSEPVRLYSLLARRREDCLFADGADRFEEALQLYYKGDFRRAFDALTALTHDEPRVGPAFTFLERTRELLENPPDGVWDGVFVAKSK